MKARLLKVKYLFCRFERLFCWTYVCDIDASLF